MEVRGAVMSDTRSAATRTRHRGTAAPASQLPEVGMSGPPGHVLHRLQRAVGNRAVGRLLRLATQPAARVAVAPPVVDEVLRTPGRPLDGAVRVRMEERFGHD